MADPKRKLAQNVDGDFFVDDTCINCDMCRQMAPSFFKDTGEYSVVCAQPITEHECRQGFQALLTCPTGSIGYSGSANVKIAIDDFPIQLDDEVYHCGFTSPKSFGGKSYFIQHPEGNWLVDAPKFLPPLVKKFKAMGGIRWIFLTHRDDVADAEEYAKEFKAVRLIHEDDAEAQPKSERFISGDDEVLIGADFRIIPTPGHTEGHMVLLYKNRFLFSGDHLWWRNARANSPIEDKNGYLWASKDFCWYSFDVQKTSLEKLQQVEFEWLLPGHGLMKQLPPNDMKFELNRLLKRL